MAEDRTREVLKSFGVLPGQPPVEQMGGGDPRLQLELRVAPETGVDADYAEAMAEAKAQAAIQEERAQALAAAPQGESPLFPAPSPPSALKTGVETGARAAGEGVRALVDGLRGLVGVGPSTGTASALNLPQPKAGEAAPNTMQAIKKVLIDGLMQLGFSPLTAGFTGAGQALENMAPEVAGATIADGFAAAGVRGLLGGTAFKDLPPDQQQAALAPLTVREILESVGPLLAPGVKGAVKKVRLAVELQKPNLASERGSVGPGGEAPGPGPTAGATAGDAGVRVESRLNEARLHATEDVKRLAGIVNALQSEALAKSRKTQTHAETIEAGKALSLTVEQALALDPLSVPLAEAKAHQQAFRDLNVAATTHLNDLVKRVKAGETGLDAQGWAAFDLAGELSAKQEMIGTESGRIIEARKIGAEAERAAFDPAEFTRLREDLAGADRGDFATTARRLDALPGGVKSVRARTWMRQTWEMLKLGRDMKHELWINMLLTNPITHVANITGTGLTTAWEIPERAFAEGVHRLFSSNPEGVQRGETAALIRGGIQGLSDGFRLAGKAARHAAELTPQERELIGRSRVEFPRAISSANVAEKMGWQTDQAWAKAVDVVGTAANLPVTGLAIEDAFFKGVNYRMELSALAMREARAEGLTGSALEARVKALEVDPSTRMMADAVDASMVRTLNNELGPAGKLLMQFANTVPGGRIVAPFIRTPVNSFKWFGQRAPILAQLSAKNWADINAGGAAREMAIARQAVGLAFTAVIAYEVSQGTITGGGPTDKWLRKMQRDPATSTRPPYSFKVGSEFYNLSRIDPLFGTFVGAVADYMELRSKIPTQDLADEWAAYGEAVVIAAGHVLINKTWMQSASALLDSINDPDRNFGKLRANQARSMVPAGLRQATRVMDDNVIRNVKSVTEAIKSGLPYYVDDVPVDRNPITGDAVEYPPGWGPDMFSPVLVIPEHDDPVFKELIANQIRLVPVPRALGGLAHEGPQMKEERTGPPIPLDAAQRDYWILAMTKHAKINGRTLHEALTDLVTSPRYQEQSTGPDGGRTLMFKAIYHGYKEKGLAMLLGESATLQAARLEQLRQRGYAKLPVTDSRSPQYGATPGSAEELIRSLNR